MTDVIVVGSGHWGQNLVRNFEQLGHLAGVVEVDPALRQRLQTNHPKVNIYDSFEQALGAAAPA
ncbi:gfo/Idh/MocA family oxidoreductase, partial [filamentous cyanobacterium CCP3]